MDMSRGGIAIENLKAGLWPRRNAGLSSVKRARITQGSHMNLQQCKGAKTHKEIVRIMVFSIQYCQDGQATSNTKARAPLPGFSRVIWDEWGKKGVRMDTKALKKQMGAAIAMVLVAAVALGSATFAWFVSNNTVKATTSNIAAQSNSAYLVIDTTKTSTSSTGAVSAPITNTTPLFPAMTVKNGTKAEWQSAYALSADKSDKKDGTVFTIGDGTAAKAVEAGYAVKDTFYVGTGTYDGEFTDLQIKSVAVKTAATGENKNLGDALRVLVVCGEKWEVWSGIGIQLSSSQNDNTASNLLAADDAVIKANQDAQIDVYLYYDGNDANVYSNNLEKIKTTAGDNGVTITFEATPKEYKGTK